MIDEPFRLTREADLSAAVAAYRDAHARAERLNEDLYKAIELARIPQKDLAWKHALLEVAERMGIQKHTPHEVAKAILAELERLGVVSGRPGVRG